MEHQVFRDKSVDRISTPEQLHDYIRVTSPRLWMLLAAVIALVAGMIIAACTFRMENTREVSLTVIRESEGEAPMMAVSLSLPKAQRETVGVGMKVRLAGTEGRITFLYEDEEEVIANIDLADPDQMLPAGNYPGELVIEEATPIGFLLN